MSTSMSFTGERFLPECGGEIAYEHLHRYAFAKQFARGKRVLDLACGEGYGSAMLARAGGQVLGVDLSAEAVTHAQRAYTAVAGCRFLVAPCDDVPIEDASFDLIVSFETIEHVDAETQQRMIAEFQRLLAPGGLILLSSPNKACYSDATNYHNEFHIHELYREDLAVLLAPHFPAQRWYRQRIQCFSTLWAEYSAAAKLQAWQLDGEECQEYAGPEPIYHVLLLARAAEDLPQDLPRLSLFVDREESLWAANLRLQREYTALGERFSAERGRLEAVIAARDTSLGESYTQVQRLETLKARCEAVVVERDAQLAQTNAHVLHLEGLVAERESLIEERDARLAAVQEHLREEQEAHARMVLELREALQAKLELNQTLQGLEAERAKLVRAVNEHVERLAEREREVEECSKRIAELQATVVYRQSFRWWLRLPLARAKMALRYS